MTRQTHRYASGLLPHSVVAAGPQVPDETKAFRAANASYRAISALGSALDRWPRCLSAGLRRLDPKGQPRAPAR